MTDERFPYKFPMLNSAVDNVSSPTKKAKIVDAHAAVRALEKGLEEALAMDMDGFGGSDEEEIEETKTGLYRERIEFDDQEIQKPAKINKTKETFEMLWGRRARIHVLVPFLQLCIIRSGNQFCCCYQSSHCARLWPTSLIQSRTFSETHSTRAFAHSCFVWLWLTVDRSSYMLKHPGSMIKYYIGSRIPPSRFFVVCLVCLPVDRLVDRSIDQLVDRLVDRPAGEPIGRSVGRLIGRPIGRPVSRPVGWRVCQPGGRLNGHSFILDVFFSIPVPAPGNIFSCMSLGGVYFWRYFDIDESQWEFRTNIRHGLLGSFAGVQSRGANQFSSQVQQNSIHIKNNTKGNHCRRKSKEAGASNIDFVRTGSQNQTPNRLAFSSVEGYAGPFWVDQFGAFCGDFSRPFTYKQHARKSTQNWFSVGLLYPDCLHTFIIFWRRLRNHNKNTEHLFF